MAEATRTRSKGKAESQRQPAKVTPAKSAGRPGTVQADFAPLPPSPIPFGKAGLDRGEVKELISDALLETEEELSLAEPLASIFWSYVR
eukprot:SAG31_NODE_522_length_14623_cov_6.071674_12_plen_89_part_00